MTRPGPTTCAECGVPIEQNRGGARKMFCSQRCRNRLYRRRKAQSLPLKACPICGGPVSVADHYRVYCSIRCRRAASYLQTVGHAPLPTTCAHCGGSMKASRRNQKYCHDRCRSRARHGSRLGLSPSPRELLVLTVGWPGAQFRRAA